MQDANVNPYLEICFRPTIATVNEARRLVAALYHPVLGDADAAGRIALTTHELLENALKYSIDGSTVIRVELSREPRNVKIETRNAISVERRAGLEEAFDEMDRATDADTFYQFAMHRTRTRRHGSGLGLARIWAEGEMKISRSYDGDEVRITAVTTISEVK
jgi:two-component sensor histidine kinase